MQISRKMKHLCLLLPSSTTNYTAALALVFLHILFTINVFFTLRAKRRNFQLVKPAPFIFSSNERRK
jgi:hypothetical protein